MITTLIKSMDHIDDVVQEAYEQGAHGFCVNTESKAILFYNEDLEIFLIAYAIDLDLFQVKINISTALSGWMKSIMEKRVSIIF